MKKLSLVLIVLVMFFAALACGGESTPAPEVQPIAEEREAEPTPIPEPTPTPQPPQRSIDSTLTNLSDAGYDFWEIEDEGYLWTNDDMSMLCLFADADYMILCTMYILDVDVEQAGYDMVLMFTAYGVSLNTLDAISDDMMDEKLSALGFEDGWRYSIESDLEDMSITVIAAKQ